mmetsp:Transcript_41734/g.138357  ORF Transcript_41734/g.138357 Transcript_41734/m.138357 type:complete len:223 (+) Transcript_41734:41-709(+)
MGCAAVATRLRRDRGLAGTLAATRRTGQSAAAGHGSCCGRRPSGPRRQRSRASSRQRKGALSHRRGRRPVRGEQLRRTCVSAAHRARFPTGRCCAAVEARASAKEVGGRREGCASEAGPGGGGARAGGSCPGGGRGLRPVPQVVRDPALGRWRLWRHDGKDQEQLPDRRALREGRRPRADGRHESAPAGRVVLRGGEALVDREEGRRGSLRGPPAGHLRAGA